MWMLVLASLAFLVTHFGISSTPLRGALLGALGENGYLGVYSAVAILTLGFMIYAWGNAPQSEFIWAPSLATTAITRALMPFSAIFLIAGLMAKNPTAVKMEAAVGSDIDGILKITRHPVQWAIFIWAAAHLIANGDQASIVFFGTFAILSGAGTLAIDRKYRAKEGEAWQRFFETTSNVPFAAAISGKAQFRASDLNWLAVGIGVILFVGLYIFHNWVSGVALY